MNYSENQYKIIEKMVNEFSLLDNKKKRLEKLAWYDMASGIKNIEVTRQIMKYQNAI